MRNSTKIIFFVATMFTMVFMSLHAQVPAVPENLAWNFTTDILSWDSPTDPDSFQVWIYQDGDLEAEIFGIAGTEREQNLNAALQALGTDATYTARVVAFNASGSSQSALSTANVKGLTNLGIIADINFAVDPVDFIFSRSGATSFSMNPFTYSSATTVYNHSTHSYADSVELSFPATGQYQLKAEFHGSSTVTTFDEGMVAGTVFVPLKPAESSAGMDANGNPNADTQNNVLTIVVNPGNSGFEKTYTLHFRRRANNPAASITNLSDTAYAFSAIALGSGSTAEIINGDNIASLQKKRWSVNSISGTGYFSENQLIGLSNGDVTVTATLENAPNISVTSGTYALSGYSNWAPHLGKLVVRGKNNDAINISPLFSSDPSAPGVYSCSILDEYSTLRLTLMAPRDSQVYIDGSRVSSNGESILRIGPTDPINGPAVISYTIRVQNAQGHKDYVLNIQREVNERLKYGRTTGGAPHLASATGDVFGMNAAATDKLTVQAWVRWTVDPSTPGVDAWANIASQTNDGAGSNGTFWLQHNQTNTSFEFAIKPTGTRRHVYSSTSLVTIERGVWYLVTGVYDGDRNPVKLYVNGTDVTDRTATTSGAVIANVTQSQFNVGKMPYGTRRFPGNVRNVRIWVGEARTAAQIAADYADTPLAGSAGDTSTFSWPLNETFVGAIVNGNGSLNLNMVNVTNADMVACCVNNRASGKALVHRPARMDFSSADSESVVLVQAKGYSGSNLRFRILGPEGVSNNEMQVWDHINQTWIGSGNISTGVLMDDELGDPAAGTYFWVPVRRNTSVAGGGRYVDDDSETSYNGSDTNVGTRTEYNTIMPLPPVTAMSSPFTLSGGLIGTTQYPLSRKYVILGFDAVEKGKLITATSSSIPAKGAKAAGSFSLKSDVPLYRIEVRTQDDILITDLKKPEGWTSTTDLGDTTLPVELSSFTVSSFNGNARLQWISQSESNLLGYYVYRGEADEVSSAILVSDLVQATNTSQVQVYVFTDSEALPNVSYFYWLMAMDFDGTTRFFGPVQITISDSEVVPQIPVKTGLDKLYPNPFNPQVTIGYGLKEAAATKLNIYNVRGQLVHSRELAMQEKGFYKFVWDASKETSGVYFVVFESGKHREVRKITLSK